MWQPHSMICWWEVPVNSFFFHLVSGVFAWQWLVLGWMPSGLACFSAQSECPECRYLRWRMQDLGTDGSWGSGRMLKALNGLCSLPVFPSLLPCPCAGFQGPVWSCDRKHWRLDSFSSDLCDLPKRKEKPGIHPGLWGKGRGLCVRERWVGPVSWQRGSGGFFLCGLGRHRFVKFVSSQFSLLQSFFFFGEPSTTLLLSPGQVVQLIGALSQYTKVAGSIPTQGTDSSQAVNA